MGASIIVPVLNAASTIEACVHALATQSPGDVIVVDGGSTDGTLERLHVDGVTVLHNPIGDPASSRNLGARHARSGLLAFTDADCVPEPGWLEAGVAAISRGADLVQGRVIPERAPGPFDRTVSVGGEHGLYETANLFVTRELFDRVGGFEPLPGLDLAPGTHFGEDVWFAWRARRAGARSAFACDAVVRHAVFERRALAFVAERWRARHFPALIAAVPELRRAFLRDGLFLSADSRRFDLAVAALALGGRRRPAMALLAPYLAARAREPRTAAARVAADVVTAAALLSGSVRHRTLVL